MPTEESLPPEDSEEEEVDTGVTQRAGTAAENPYKPKKPDREQSLCKRQNLG